MSMSPPFIQINLFFQNSSVSSLTINLWQTKLFYTMALGQEGKLGKESLRSLSSREQLYGGIPYLPSVQAPGKFYRSSSYTTQTIVLHRWRVSLGFGVYLFFHFLDHCFFTVACCSFTVSSELHLVSWPEHFVHIFSPNTQADLDLKFRHRMHMKLMGLPVFQSDFYLKIISNTLGYENIEKRNP